MEYHILLVTTDQENQASVAGDVATAMTRAALLVPGVASAEVIQMGTELNPPVPPEVPTAEVSPTEP